MIRLLNKIIYVAGVYTLLQLGWTYSGHPTLSPAKVLMTLPAWQKIVQEGRAGMTELGITGALKNWK